MVKESNDPLNSKIEEPEILVKEVKIQYTGRQLVVPIPAQICEALEIKKGDSIIFSVPLNNTKEYSIKIKRG